jgi:hypothetical protein
MNDTDRHPHTVDDKIAGQFAHMRAVETASAPTFIPQLKAEPHAPAMGYHIATRVLPRLAAAVAVVALGTTFLSNPQQEDPAELYTGIMKKQHMQTDSLLFVSDSVLPALTSVPSLYDMDAESDIETYTN